MWKEGVLWKEWRAVERGRVVERVAVNNEMSVKSIRENLYKININVDISVLMMVLKFDVFRPF